MATLFIRRVNDGDGKPLYQVVDRDTDEVLSEAGSRTKAKQDLENFRYEQEDLVELMGRRGIR